MKYSKEEKAMWLEDWQKSGKVAWTYAKENGLIPQTFCSWTKNATEAKKEFVEVHPKAKTQSTILIEKGDVKIHIPTGISSDELGIIIESLRAAV